MALDFPNAPTNGQTYTGPNGVIWTWDGAKWANGTVAGAYAPVISPVFTGDPKAPTPSPGDSDTSVATTAFVQAAVAPAYNDRGRNLLHNPLFNVAQRGAGPWTTGFTADRWSLAVVTSTLSASIITLADADRAAIGDEAATRAMQYVITGTAGAGDFALAPAQNIESIRRLSGKTVAVSFWARATAGTPKLGVSIQQYFGAGGSPSAAINGIGAQTVTLSTTWTRYTTTPISIPSTSGKTLGTDGTDSTGLLFCGSSGATNNANFGSPGVQSYTLQIWGVQLEIGSVATPLEKPDLRYDLANCQRFYQFIDKIQLAVYSPVAGVVTLNCIPFSQMRAIPTATSTLPTYTNSSALNYAPASASVCQCWFTVAATGLANVVWGLGLSADL